MVNPRPPQPEAIVGALAVTNRSVSRSSTWLAGRFDIDLSSPKIMGILNLTPDSFSDGGRFLSPDQALSHAHQLLQDGADLIDVGAESSRPGALPVSAEEEWARLKDVLAELVRWNCPISLDTYRPETMRKGLDLGIDVINDIWAFRQPGALELVRGSRCGLCVMHMHGDPQTMQLTPIEQDSIQRVKDFFQDVARRFDQFGIDSRRWVMDPGIGFGKTASQNFSLLARQHELMELGQAVLVGWSRKSTLGQVTGLSPDQRLIPSVAAAVLAVDRGASVVRVHDVAQTRQALQVWSSVTNLE